MSVKDECKGKQQRIYDDVQQSEVYRYELVESCHE